MERGCDDATYGICGRKDYAELVVTGYWESREMIQRRRYGIDCVDLVFDCKGREQGLGRSWKFAKRSK